MPRMPLLAQQLEVVSLSARVLRVAPELALLWTVVEVAIRAPHPLRACVQRTAETLRAARTACRLERARTLRTELLLQRVVRRHIYLPAQQPIY